MVAKASAIALSLDMTERFNFLLFDTCLFTPGIRFLVSAVEARVDVEGE